MIHSGIAPLDQLGGVVPGRLHLLTGGPGTGKSTACLQFLRAGLQEGEVAVLLTLDRLDDLVSHARSTGLELEPSLRAGRLLLLRFRAEFITLLAGAGLPDRVIGDLRQLIAGVKPARLVIDPLTPFLADGSASGAALAALAQLLDQIGVTAILTYPGDVSDRYDARLDAVVQRAASIVHLARADGINRLQIVQTRSRVAPASSVRYVFRPGTGLVMLDGETHSTELSGGVGTNGARERVLSGEAAS